MFCPKCGTQAIDGTKFCRSCGTDLEAVSAVLSGKLKLSKNQKLILSDDENLGNINKLWNEFVTATVTGLGCIIFLAVLAMTGDRGGQVIGVALILPVGLVSLGAGVTYYLKAKRLERRQQIKLSFSTANVNQLQESIEFVSPLQRTTHTDSYTAPARNINDIVASPASVIEHTTKHLQVNSEGETINLPEQR